jgi:hypothetical protein
MRIYLRRIFTRGDLLFRLAAKSPRINRRQFDRAEFHFAAFRLKADAAAE